MVGKNNIKTAKDRRKEKHTYVYIQAYIQAYRHRGESNIDYCKAIARQYNLPSSCLPELS